MRFCSVFLAPATLRPPLVTAAVMLALAACQQEDAGSPTAPESAPSFAVGSNTWTARAPIPGEARFGISAAHFPNSDGESLVYVFGGRDEVNGTPFGISVYNVATNTWGGAPGGPFSVGVSVYNRNGVAAIGSKLYVSGGYNSEDGGVPDFNNQLWAYDVVSHQLVRKADLPRFTAEGVSGVIAGKLYVLAGQCDADNWPRAGTCQFANTRKLFRYDPGTNTWATRQPAPHVHRSAAGGVINGKFYVAGGIGTRTVDVYDPAANSWKTLASIPRSGAASGTVLGGKLFVIVGTSAYTYNPQNNTWATVASPTFSHEAVVRVRLNGNPRVLAVGGNHGSESSIPNDSELYTP
ncbi:MAG TPA: hypothetical protein VJ808_07825 [Gemmatimonadales bacterium]|nr:hypothetical protein [Gemmatimonadales bacterium]